MSRARDRGFVPVGLRQAIGPAPREPETLASRLRLLGAPRELAAPEFRVRRATSSDLPAIRRVMDSAAAATAAGLYVADDDEFLAAHIELEGFILLAEAAGEVVGFVLVRRPGDAPDNLGHDLGLPPDELAAVAHMESGAIVRGWQGRGLPRLLNEAAEAAMRAAGVRLAAATCSPDNPPVLRAARMAGYEIVWTGEKYGGLRRHILFKRLEPEGGPCDSGDSEPVISQR